MSGTRKAFRLPRAIRVVLSMAVGGCALGLAVVAVDRRMLPVPDGTLSCWCLLKSHGKQQSLPMFQPCMLKIWMPYAANGIDATEIEQQELMRQLGIGSGSSCRLGQATLIVVGFLGLASLIAFSLL